MRQRTVTTVLCAALALGAANEVRAQDAGTVVFARGDVTAERQPAPVPLAKGDDVFQDDVVATGEAARAQLLMLDGAKIAIRPNSRLRIDEYVFQGTPATQTTDPVVATSGDRSVSTLIKGGFRTITGAIGRDDREAYEVRTPVGVLGIRGTDYSAVFCNADCTWVPGVSAANPIEDGLYLGVTEGSIIFSNEIANLVLVAGEYAFIPLIARVPQQLDAPPSVLIDDNDLVFDPSGQVRVPDPANYDPAMAGFDPDQGPRREPPPPSSAPPGGAGQGATAGAATAQGLVSGIALPAQATLATNADGATVSLTQGLTPQPQGSRNISYSVSEIGPIPRWQEVVTNAADEYRLGAGNELTGFFASYPSRTGVVPADWDIGTASNTDTGFDSVTVLRWGRWTGGVANVDLGGGQVDPLDLTNQSLHWVSGPESGTPVMPITGNASYTLIGSTAPTDNLGNVGVLGNATFDADFTNQSVFSTLDITIGTVNWIASGSGGIGTQADPVQPAHRFNGSYLLTIGGQTGGFGVFSGFFSEPGPTSDSSFPGGVGLTYSLSDPNNTQTVSGAAVFGNP